MHAPIVSIAQQSTENVMMYKQQTFQLAADETPAEEKTGAIDRTKYKTKMCRNYLNGTECPYGERCAFAHGEVEVLDKATAAHAGPAAAARQQASRRDRSAYNASAQQVPPLVAPEAAVVEPPRVNSSYDPLYVPQSQYAHAMYDTQAYQMLDHPAPQQAASFQQPLQPQSSFESTRSGTPPVTASSSYSAGCSTPLHSSDAASDCPTPAVLPREVPTPPPMAPVMPTGSYRYEPYGEVFMRVPSDMTTTTHATEGFMRVDTPDMHCVESASEDTSSDLGAEIVVTTFA